MANSNSGLSGSAKASSGHSSNVERAARVIEEDNYDDEEDEEGGKDRNVERAARDIEEDDYDDDEDEEGSNDSGSTAHRLGETSAGAAERQRENNNNLDEEDEDTELPDLGGDAGDAFAFSDIDLGVDDERLLPSDPDNQNAFSDIDESGGVPADVLGGLDDGYQFSDIEISGDGGGGQDTGGGDNRRPGRGASDGPDDNPSSSSSSDDSNDDSGSSGTDFGEEDHGGDDTQSSDAASEASFDDDRQDVASKSKTYRDGPNWQAQRQQQGLPPYRVPYTTGRYTGPRLRSNEPNARIASVVGNRLRGPGFPGLNALRTAAAKATKPLARKLRPKKLNFIRMLGWGGWAVTALFDARDEAGNVTRYVAKCPYDRHIPGPNEGPATISVGRSEVRREKKAFRREKKIMKEYIRCLHVVQVFEKSEQVTAGMHPRPDPDRFKEGIEMDLQGRKRKLEGEGSDDDYYEPMTKKAKEEVRSRRRKQPTRQARRAYLARRHQERQRDEENDDPLPFIKFGNDADNVANAYLMEFMTHGTMHNFLKKIGSRENPRTNIPTRILWHMLGCLVRACIAIRYPVRKQTWADYRQAAGETAADGPLIKERMPRGRQKGRDSHLVHFDIDPTNFLIGDFGHGSEAPAPDRHLMVPVFKVSDFGMASKWPEDRFYEDYNDPNRDRNRRQLWDHRNRGKHGYLAPEQFTEEWDWIKNCPRQSRHRRGTAGEYSWRTNLFQIGAAMLSALTLLYPQESRPLAVPFAPPRQQHGNDNNDDQDDEDEASSEESESSESESENDLRDRFPQDPALIPYSYAWVLREPQFQHVDQDLASVIFQCMAHDPRDRPDLHHLEALIEDKLREEDADWPPHESHDEALRWAKEVFQDPPKPAVRRFDDLRTWFSGRMLHPPGGLLAAPVRDRDGDGDGGENE